jgi:iron-sulfur cluster repair protein YtfE (RIC family)
MAIFTLRTPPKQSLSLLAICNEIQTEHQSSISQGCNNIINYLKKNEYIEDVLPSVSEVVHIILYKLSYEIKQCFLKEKQELYPLIVTATAKDRLKLTEAMEPFREKHELILNIVKKLRQLLCDYVTQPHWSKEFRDFINELFSLENNLYKWIHIEEDLLFPKLMADLEKERHISTVFR